MFRHLILTLTAAILAVPNASASGLGPDSNELKMTLREDPVFPIPEIGARRFFCRILPESGWTNVSLFLRFSDSSLQLATNQSLGANGITIIPASQINLATLGNGARNATWVMPSKKRLPDGGLTPDLEPFPDGYSGFYQWVLEFNHNNTFHRRFGEVHSFAIPRRLVFGIVGDSFGSGEGAAAPAPTPWIDADAHRSRLSGGELTMANFRHQNPNLAFDYFNTTSSGAIAHDIHSTMAQNKRDEDGQGIDRPQAELIEQFMRNPKDANGRGFRPSYQHIDAIVLSCGGNDFGFSTMVFHYFGMPLHPYQSLVHCLQTSAFFGVLAVPVFTTCMGFEILSNYTFELGYKAPFVSNDQHRFFDFYEARLYNEYLKLENRLVRDLGKSASNPSNPYDVHHVLVTEYPNPLRPCANHVDTKLFSVESFNSTIEIPLFISVGEASEINNKLAVRTQGIPRPSSGGINHAIAEIVQATNNLSTADWSFVPTGHLVSQSAGVCQSSRQFASVRDSFSLPGPNAENNAIHPNRQGHSQIYFPAINSALAGKISPQYRIDRAASEGLQPGSPVFADLVIEQLRVTNYDPDTRQVDFELVYSNRSSKALDPGELQISVQVGTTVSFDIRLDPLPLPGLAPGAISNVIPIQRTIPSHPSLSQLPRLGCLREGKSFSPGKYALTDLALAHWFLPDAIFKATATTSSPESNLANNTRQPIHAAWNPTQTTFRVGPPITQAELAQVLQGFRSHINNPSATPSDIDLTLNTHLEFFGFFDPVAEWSNQSQGRLVSAALFINLVTSEIDFPNTWDRDDLRNFIPCSGSRAGAISQNLSNTLRDILEFERNLPNDARLMNISLVFEHLVGIPFSRPFDLVAPNLGVGLFEMPPIEPISLQQLSLEITLPSGVTAYQFSAGLSPHGSEFARSPILTPPNFGPNNAPPPNMIDLSGLPADGRPWFLTIMSSRDDGTIVHNLYEFQTQPRNPRLISPGPDETPDPLEPRIRWVHGNQPADGYRVRLGSTPGGWDLHGRDPADPEAGAWILGPDETQTGVSPLPTDGRTVHLTLEVLRGHEWHEEYHQFQAPQPSEPILIHPTPGQSLGASFHVRLSPGAIAEGTASIHVGSSKGAKDWFIGRAQRISSDESGWDVFLPNPDPRTPDVHITILPDDDETRAIHWVFPRSMNSTLSSPAPNPFAPLPAGPASIEWQAGHDVEGCHVTIGTVPGRDNLGSETSLGGSGTLRFNVPNPDLTSLIFIRIESIRTQGENGVEDYVLRVSSDSPLYKNDGIDDFLQTLLFGSNNPNGTAGADANQNGDSNLTDFLAGLDPTTPGERWSRRGEVLPDGRVRFEMPAIIPATQYRIQRSNNLTDWEDHGPVETFDTTITNGIIETTIRPGFDNEFYRLVLEPR